MSDLTYNTIAIADLNSIDFKQIEQTSIETIRKSIDETQFVIKWKAQPSFIKDGTVTPLGTYNHAQCIELMGTSFWSTPEPE
jgi:hypothetical protein